MKNLNTNKLIILSILLGSFFTNSILAQDAKSIIFKDARKAYNLAKEKRADILSPSKFEDGLELFEEANSDYDRGSNLSGIKEDLKEAIIYFEKSLENIDVAEVLFSETLNARDDALDAEANTYEKELWVDAEDKFKDATHQFEKGKSSKAKQKSKEAHDLYRVAELAAIKSNLFNNARKLIAEAEDMKADKIAPTTFSKARKSLKDGLYALNTERYDTDKPRILAKNAEYEARHSIYLVDYIEKFEDQDKEIEDLILEGELYLTRIGNVSDVSVKFDEGSGVASDKISGNIVNLKDSISRLNHNMNNSDRKIANQEKQIANLNGQITDFNQQIKNLSKEKQKQIAKATKEQEQLLAQMAYEQEIQEKFEAVFKMFDVSEAAVFQQGNNIILRMISFDFDIGSAEVKPKNYPVLKRVEKAINIFSKNQIVIQGHTDSQGSDTLNLTLSQNRADAVKAYLIANMPGYNQSNISSVGFGESKPIANNETKFGRAKNRRIDIVIKVEEF